MSAPPAPSSLGATERGLATARNLLRGARYEEALAALEVVREDATEAPTGSRTRELRAQIEVLAATANVALGRKDAARMNFARALATQPDLRLDRDATSPKVLDLFEETRQAALGGGPP